MSVTMVKVCPGLRVGTWEPNTYRGKPFTHMGFYAGPDLGDRIPGEAMEQNLMEGLLRFRVGVLFRPDLGKWQKLETILILNTYFPEMWEYETWQLETG